MPLGFVEGDYDFPETETERSNNWSLAKRCGKAAISGSSNDQRNDPSCPNVLLINTDDMAWADISINNPSKEWLENTVFSQIFIFIMHSH